MPSGAWTSVERPKLKRSPERPSLAVPVELMREIFRDPVVEKAGAELEQRVRLDGRAHLRQPRFLLHRLDPSGPRPSLWPEQRTPTRDEDGGADPVRHPVRKLVAIGDRDLRRD